MSNKKCFRCNGALKDVTPESVTKLRFWGCESCTSQYTENSEGRLFDRWLMPITLPLYEVIFSREPLEKVDSVVASIILKDREFIDILIEHIAEELERPKQKVSDIHEFKCTSETKLREFLKAVMEGVEIKRATKT